MKLSISNIAWDMCYDEQMYFFLEQEGFLGLEIAPTRIFQIDPYEKLDEAKEFSEKLKKKYGIVISSLQSIWFGKNENLFRSEDERNELIKYTKKAINFAQMCGCKNLVFGCPKNRNLDKLEQYSLAVEFFRELGEYAKLHETVIAIEPNPTIYNTNFINYTNEAFKIVDDVNSSGFKVNIDLGTILYNKEDLSWIETKLDRVNHIHISEPYLEKVKINEIHESLAQQLKNKNYDKFISIEMKNNGDINSVKEILKSVKKIF
ncbi:sugar phosphate isomerase/epimerase family protein [Clostridium saccharoperbutylacetonicum]|uniref:sugar phosphate isomerase/epimerase family protein n=1 Tax=Clostridium saccharoperbutylacetonicum TaxID=36745 RepID=UPI000983AD06|nr:sugar phosphate isomerase/epimerase family protein [Clostridium saccharoperbutylacetonicum]AQR97830.1 xylose isomerase-like TIM barrel [Clostridium saccharoperbutylacetonicum]NSB33722.1 sugar phosphate isomerase/epimerase [Clostridium saccharoperbutylacetonicum]